MISLFLLVAAQVTEAPERDAFSLEVRAVIAQRRTVPPAEYLRRLEALAQTDDVAAELLGELLMRGDGGIPADPARACPWFERGAGKRGDATHNLALCYERGFDRPVDLARSRKLYAQAAALGWVQAKCALGNLLARGQGGPVDGVQGARLCHEAAEAGNANAQADYGIFLIEGKVVAKDMVAARRWLTAAAEQKQANAAFIVAQIHWYGDGTPRDLAVAERWWRVAYEGGRKDAAIYIAQAIFGQIPQDGDRITDRRRIPEWVEWLGVAAAEDPDPAKRAEWKRTLESLKKKSD